MTRYSRCGSRITLPPLLALFGTLLAAPLAAAELTIGYKAHITSVDPHVAFGPNRNMAMHVYEALVRADDAQRPQPGLALSWRAIDETHWEFKLRPGVVFQDGTPFTAADAQFSLRRAGGGAGARSYRSYTRDIASVEVVDPLTLRITTHTLSPFLPQNLSTFGMISATAAADATEADFDGGRAAIGTGPYRLAGWARGASLTLRRHDAYWGGQPDWDQVRFRFMPNDATRVAALLAGELDVIDAVPASLVETIRGRRGLTVETTTTGMLNYLQIDQREAPPPGVSAADGSALPGNPFRDLRVRQAMTLAIDRSGLAQRIMLGESEPSGQLVPAALGGHVAGLDPLVPDLARARALLAEAGYPQGFRVTLRCTGDRYPNDAKVCEALAQMLTRTGIRTTLEVLPSAVFFPRSNPGGPGGEVGLGLAMVGFGPANGEAAASLAGMLHSYDPTLGLGTVNGGRYGQPAVDAAIRAALRTLDATERQRQVEIATRLAIGDVGIIPIHFIRASWAFRDSLVLRPRTDGASFAMNIRLAR